jgi:threonine/homoserine/homoserine lactone efflux protein
VVLGFAIAAPVGPIGVLCIRRSLAEGRAAGFASGLGAATADAAYGALAGFGLTVVTAFLVEGQGWLRLVGGAFLCYLGLRTLLARPAEEAADVRKKGGGLIAAYASTFFLTLTNPMTILSFAAVFAGMGAGAGEDRASTAFLVLGVFLGSALWWLLLSGGAGLFRGRVGSRGMRAVNLLSGVLILAFGVAALWSVVP